MGVVNIIPNWLSAELILGIIGTITGILSLLIHYFTLRREKPNILPEVTECRHYMERTISGKQVFRLELSLRIRNTGNKGTTLNKIEVLFYDKQKRYLIENDLFQPSDTLSLMPTLPTKNIWIEPHTIGDMTCVFILENEVITQQVLECLFILYHTHKKVQFKATSPYFPQK